jgi:hypothetical protein
MSENEKHALGALAIPLILVALVLMDGLVHFITGTPAGVIQ